MAAERLEQAEEFTQELERLLRGERVAAEGEVGEALQAAQLLAAGCPAPEPEFAAALKQRLLRRVRGAEGPLPEQRVSLSEAAPPSPIPSAQGTVAGPLSYPLCGGDGGGSGQQAPAPQPSPLRGRTPYRQTALTRATAVLGAILLLALAYIGPLATVTRAVQAILRSVRLGAYTEVVQVPTLTATALAEPAAPRWKLDFAGIEFSGPLFAGGSPTARTLPLAQAQEEAGFPVRCPEGLALSEARLIHDGLQPRLFLFYQGPKGVLILYESPVGQVQLKPAPVPEPQSTPGGPAVAPSTVSVSFSRVYSEGPLLETTARGRPAVWMAQSAMLTWEEDGIHYALAGPGLTLEQAQQIASTLR